jgi:hypothetical protein
MASKSKESRLEQQGYWEQKLEERISQLSEQGIDRKKIAKDSNVKKIRSKIRDTQKRLQAIEAKEKKSEDMAKRKAEKEAGPKKAKEKKKKEVEKKSEISKRQQKKKKKKESKSKESKSEE